MKCIKLYAYLNDNLGDDLMVEILLNRYPKYQFIYSGKLKKYEKLSSHKNFITRDSLRVKWSTLNRICNILTLYKRKDFFIDYLLKKMQRKSLCTVHIGGSIFMEHDLVAKQVAEEKKKMEDSPLFIIGANFGPYVQQEFKDAFYECFRNCEDICFRDRASYQLFAELENVRYAPDVVFNYSNTIKKNSSKDVIISVIDFRSRPNLNQYADVYETFICNICRECVLHGLQPVLVSFCKNEGDDVAIQRVYDNLSAEIKNKVETLQYQDTGAIINKIANAQFTIATRFHAMILSILFDVPFLSIAYNEKVSNVLDDMNCDAYCAPEDINKISVSDVLCCTKITIDSQKYADESQKQFEALDVFLEKYN